MTNESGKGYRRNEDASKRQFSSFILHPSSFILSLIILSFALVLLLGGCGRMGCGRRPAAGPPYSPKDALQTFQLAKNFRIELFAAEPLVTSPVAMEFDEYGRIYVVEMPGYPLDTAGSGRVKLLEDTDGDGLPDRSTVLVDKLVLPTGVMRWKKGILVTDPPNVWYFEDTDGDNRADVRRVVLSGFAFTNPQHTVNGLVYGLDNWIYLAHEPPATAVVFKDKFGDRGSPIRFPDRPDIPPLNVYGRNVRFRPDRFQLEALSGSSQFGHAFDVWGHRFTLNNSNHLRHEVIAARYLQRNPDLLIPTAMQDLSDHGNAAEVFPITHNPQHQMLTDVGRITSACSLTLYLSDQTPSNYDDRFSFVAEPAHNLVHSDVLSDAGSTFTAQRASRPGAEFLASTDSWFRPVNFYIGPDGALYVLDFYRQIIEHPEWMAREVYESKAIYNGIDKGRIYRLVPESHPPARPKNIRLGDASDAELVKYLGHGNIWWRRTAQRLLVDRQSPAAVEPLVRLFQESPSPVARVHALWTLEGLGQLDAGLIAKALADGTPGVRENAIQLAEAHRATAPALMDKLPAMVEDPDPKVRFQLLCTLGYLDSAAARAARERLLFENIEDEWMQVAALSASDVTLPLFETAVSRLAEKQTKGRTIFFRRLASMIAARRQADALQRVIQTIARSSAPESEWWRAAGLEGLAQGMQVKAKAPVTLKGVQPSLLKLLDSPAAAVRRACLQLLEVTGLSPDAALNVALPRAAATAVDKPVDPERRADAIRLLTLTDPAPHTALLQSLVDPQEPEPVRAAAVRALGRIQGDAIAVFLLKRWRTMTPKVRTEAGDALFREPSRVRLFLAALKNGEAPTWMLDARHRHKFIMYADPTIRESARPLLEGKIGDRQKVVERYEAALRMEGNAARGEQIFKTICARCHQMNGVGGRLGPDLATVRNRTPEALLMDILIPSRSIAQNYEVYVIQTTGGGMLEGVIGTETPTTITLRHEDGTEDLIPRANIKGMYASPISAMPEDLDKQIDVRQMADLLKYLKTAR